LCLIGSDINSQLDYFIATWLTVGERHVIDFGIRTTAVIVNDQIHHAAHVRNMGLNGPYHQHEGQQD
jgi:hypothetical protein